MKEALVIIPTYNERENIESIIKEILSFNLFDVLIVDDNSPDGTADLVKAIQAKEGEKVLLLQRAGKLGLGTAYIEGFGFALQKNYSYTLQIDADFSHNPKDLVRLFEACSVNGFDLAIGSRYITGVNVVNWPMGRVLMSYLASRYVRLITGMTIHDTTAGFVCYRKEVLQTIPLQKVKFVGYAFQIEMKFLTWKYGFKITEVPIIFTDRTKGVSKMSAGIFKEAFFGVIQMTIQSWFKKYQR